MTTYFTSDLHLGHANIIEFCDRPFKSVDEMNGALIDRWNDTVENDDDIVIVIGDHAMGKITETLPLTDELRGKKYLVPGNHDRCWHGHGHPDRPAWEVIPSKKTWDQWCVDYLKYFDGVIMGPVRRRIGSARTMDGLALMLNHFPHRPTGLEVDEVDKYAKWRVPPHENGVLLCGHVHDAWRTLDRVAINVGVDVWDFRPVELGELLLALKYDEDADGEMI